MKKEYNLKNLNRVNRPEWAYRKNLKVVKTIRLDLDIVEWAVKESLNKGMGYQTFINTQLKEAMKRNTQPELRKEIREIVREEIKKQAS